MTQNNDKKTAPDDERVARNKKKWLSPDDLDAFGQKLTQEIIENMGKTAHIPDENLSTDDFDLTTE